MKPYLRAILGLLCLSGCYNIQVSPRDNEAPTANADTLSTNEDTPLFSISFAELLANDTDPNADALTITNISAVQSGTLTLKEGPQTIEFVPPLNFNGLVTFSYTISDGEFTALATATIDVLPINDAPVAEPLVTQTLEDTPVTMTFFANDIEGNNFTFVIDTPPSDGIVVASGTNFIYTPNSNFFGADSFTIRAKDAAEGPTTTVTVNISPVNDFPVSIDDVVQTNEDSIVDIILSATDVEDDITKLEFVVIGPPSQGTLLGVTPNLTYRPNPNFFGDDTITFLVFDVDGAVAQGKVEIEVDPIQDAPIAQALSFRVNELTSKTFNISGLDVDGEGLTFTVLTALLPGQGTLSVVSDNDLNDQVASLTYTAPDLQPPVENLTVPVTFEVNDGSGTATATSTALINIIVGVQNNIPVAGNDTKTISEDAGLSFSEDDLLANDSDADDGDVDLLFVKSFQKATNCVPFIVDGVITVTFAPNFNGLASFEYIVSDTLGEGIGVVNITVTSVNDAPNAENDLRNAPEDATTLLTGLLANDSDIENDTLSISTVQNFTNCTAEVSGNNVNVTPTQNFTGLATFDYTVSDGNGGFDTAKVSVTVDPVNDPPVAFDDADSTNEDTLLVKATSVYFTNDTDTENDTLSITAVSSPVNGTVNLVGTTITFTPDVNFFGAASFDYTVSDGNGGTDIGRVNVTVAPVNDAPSFDTIANQIVNEDAASTNITINGVSAGPANEAAQVLIFSAVSSNPALIPNPIITGSGVTRTLAFQPVANVSGTATITVTVIDDGGTANGGVDTFVRTFTITINAVNDAPSFDAIANQTANEDAASTNVTITTVSAGPDDEVAQLVTVIATSSNTAIVPNPTISGSGVTRTLAFTPVANQNGTVTITVTATDNGGIANGGLNTFSRTFTITVNGVNDAPSFDAIANQTVNEDAASTNVTITTVSAGPDDEVAQVVTVTATSSNTAVVPNPTISGVGGSRILAFAPAPNAFGSVTITVTATDNGGTANGGLNTFSRTFTITVNPVNDAPVNSVPGLQTTAKNTNLTFTASNLISIADIDAGGANVEVLLLTSGGTVALSTTTGLTVIGNNTNTLRATGPLAAINTALNGLVFTPTPAVSGLAGIDLTISDLGNTGSGNILTDNDTVRITVHTCGDGLFEVGEACDDGNITNGDGCSSTCIVEANFNCLNKVALPSVCTAPLSNNESNGAAEADFCNLQFPPSITLVSNDATPSVFGRIFEAGVTNSAGQSPGISAELGFGPVTSDPTTAGGWSFFAAMFNLQIGNDDEFGAIFRAPVVDASTNFNYTYRFSLNSGASYTYCDLNGAGSNVGLIFETTQLGPLTVNP
jgi:large repetitive protein